MVMILVLALGITTLAVVGCGGDTKQAQVYMEAGDALSGQMSSFTDESVFDVAALLTELGIDVAETGNVDPKTITDAARKKLDSIIGKGEEAKVEYEKIADLEGVDEYKEYARARIDAIDSTVVVLEAVEELLDRIADPNNTKSMSDTVVDWAKDNAGAALEAVKAYTYWKNAADVKKKNELGGAEKPVEEVPEDSAPE
jgi:hypothetical protein